MAGDLNPTPLQFQQHLYVLVCSCPTPESQRLQAAIAQRLTSELRQNLFVALMGAEDFEDAVERVILAAGAAKNGHSEACVVLFHCAIREKKPPLGGILPLLLALPSGVPCDKCAKMV